MVDMRKIYTAQIEYVKQIMDDIVKYNASEEICKYAEEYAEVESPFGDFIRVNYGEAYGFIQIDENNAPTDTIWWNNNEMGIKATSYEASIEELSKMSIEEAYDSEFDSCYDKEEGKEDMYLKAPHYTPYVPFDEKKQYLFEVSVVPNIRSKTDGTKGCIDTVLSAYTLKGAFMRMYEDRYEVANSSLANLYHYTFEKYDETLTHVVEVTHCDCNGCKIDDLKKWINSLPEEQLQDPREVLNAISFIHSEMKPDFKVDEVLEIIQKNKSIGYLYLNTLSSGEYFLEWVELFSKYKGKRLFRKVLLSLMQHLKTDTLVLEASEDNIEMYKYLGAEVVEYDEFREMTKMKLGKSQLKQEVKK